MNSSGVTNQRQTVSDVCWRDVLPMLGLLPPLRLAARFRVLVLALIGLYVTNLGWWLLAKPFGAQDLYPVFELSPLEVSPLADRTLGGVGSVMRNEYGF